MPRVQPRIAHSWSHHGFGSLCYTVLSVGYDEPHVAALKCVRISVAGSATGKHASATSGVYRSEGRPFGALQGFPLLLSHHL